MTIRAIRTGNPMGGRWLLAAEHRPDPPACVIAQRPPLALSVGTTYPTDENLDAQAVWLAHIEVGRIAVK